MDYISEDSMQLPQFSLKTFIFKLIVAIIIIYVTLIAASITITAYLFFTLNSYKPKLEQYVLTHTGYSLTIDKITTSFSDDYLPDIVLTNVKLANPTNAAQACIIRHVELVISYSSLWQFMPIFRHIHIQGTNLDLKYLADNSITLNGINFNHPDKQIRDNASSVDLEKLLLKQKEIDISDINFSFTDKKHHLPKIELHNITANLKSGYFNHHNLHLTFGHGSGKHNLLAIKFAWVGNKVSEFSHWQSAELKIQSLSNNNNNMIRTLKNYIPEISILDEFDAQTALDAAVKNGKLQFLYANFDVQNLRYIFAGNKTSVDFPDLGGSIRIDLINQDSYTLQANNLTLTVPNGAIFKNKSIHGNYTLNKNGNVSVANTDLSSFNNLLKLVPTLNKISISGQLNILGLSWLGGIFNPNSLSLTASFTNLAVTSKDPQFPSINNISGSVLINKNSGFLNLSLVNSVFWYKDVFMIPYKFNTLTAQISWHQNPDHSIKFILAKTPIKTPDFSGYAAGNYVYVPGTLGHLSLQAHIESMAAHKVGDYLPIIIGKPVHEWLDMALVGGMAESADLDLQGKLDDFPFPKNQGKFYITANVKQAKLRYLKDWPVVEAINGQFQIRNGAIIIKAENAIIAGNHVESTTAIIPDMTSSTVYLDVNSSAYGSTPNFLHYLSQTPINNSIGDLPNKTVATGNGKVKLFLHVPLTDPVHTRVAGTYSFNNNNVQFEHLPIPILHNVNGDLFFFESGIRISKITAHALDSTLDLNATTKKNGIITFNTRSPNLDYLAATQFYLPFISPIIHGTASTNITFDVSTQGLQQLTLQSNLQGVSMSAPEPLFKDTLSRQNLVLTITNAASLFALNFNYTNVLFGNIDIDHVGQITHGSIAVGQNKLPHNTSNNPKIIIAANLINTDALAWGRLINKLLTLQSKQQRSLNSDVRNADIETSTQPQPVDAKQSNSVLPLEVLFKTNNLFIESRNFYSTNADILVTQNKTIFNLNNALASGYGQYNSIKNTLDIHLNNFDLLKTASSNTQTQPHIAKPSPTNLTWTEFAKMNLVGASTKHNKIESHTYISLTPSLGAYIESDTSVSSFPNTNLSIDHFYYENHNLGKFHVSLIPANRDLLIKHGVLGDSASTLTFDGVNFCSECSADKALVDLKTHMKINDLGQLLENLNYGKVIYKGHGSVDAAIQWNGQIQDFDLKNVVAAINIDVKDGKFLKVDTGNVIGQLLGLINLQTITNLVTLDFGQIFSNGFYFNHLKIQAYLRNSSIDLKSMSMNGPLAIVNSNGIIDLGNDKLDLSLTVIPHLGTSVAIGAAVATLNPVVGLATYAAEWALDEPFNKLFTFSFEITGTLEKPIVTKKTVSHQIINNVNSTVGL